MDKKSLDGVTRFYQEKLGQSLDFQEKPSWRWLKILGFIFLFSILFSGGYFFIFQTKKGPEQGMVALEIVTPAEVSVGENFSTTIIITNQEKFVLKNIELEIFFPDDFYLELAEPACAKISIRGCLWRWSEILKDEEDEVRIWGKIFSQVGEKKIIKTVLNFQLAGFSSQFKKEAFKEIVIQPYPLEISLSGTKELMIGEEGEYRISVKNQKKETVKIKVVTWSTSDFNYTLLNPETEKDDYSDNFQLTKKSWLFDLSSYQQRNFDFKGFFSQEEEKEKFLKIKVFLVSPAQKEFLQTEQEFPISLTKIGLALGLRINNSFEKNQIGEIGDNLNFQLNYKNIGREKIFNPLIKFKISQSDFFDLAKISSHRFWFWLNGQKSLQGNQWKMETIGQEKYLIWNKDQIPALEVLEPTEEGEINFSLKIKPFEEIIHLKPNRIILNFSWFLEANVFRQQIIVVKVASEEINYQIKTKVRLASEARYFDEQGLIIGQGPLPPKVGETTTYVLFLRLTNTFNELKNIKITAILPEKINWVGEEKKSHGFISFDYFSKKIIWQIDSLSPYMGSPYSFVEASFKISLTPTEEDRGKILTLIEKTFLDADDSLTGAKISTELPSIDANLETDFWVKGRGRVE